MVNDIEILVKGIGKLDINTKDSEDFGISLIFNLSDIKDIGSRKASFSKTIKILGTKDNNIIFDQLYEIKGQNFLFDMTKKHNCVLLVNKNPVLDGFLVLKKITKLLIGTKYEVVYEIVLFDEVKNFFDDLDGKKLYDLDFSSGFTYTGTTGKITYDVGDHQLNPAQIVNTNNSVPNYTNVYTYPLIDYGYYIPPNPGGIGTSSYYPYNDTTSSSLIFPAIYQKSILVKIFVDSNYSYTSNYFDGTTHAGFFTNMLNVYNKKTEFRNVDFCEYTTDQSVVIPVGLGSFNFQNIKLGKYGCYIDSIWTNYYELHTEFLDIRQVTGTTADPVYATGITVTVDGKYNIVFRVDVMEDKSGVFIMPPTPTPSEISSLPIVASKYEIVKLEDKNGELEVLQTLRPDDMKSVTGKTSTEYAFTYEGVLEDVELKENDFIYLKITVGVNLIWDDVWVPEFTPITLWGSSVEMIYKKSLIPKYSGITYNGSQDILINEALPDMTQSDFMRNHIKLANLYIWSNKEDATNLFIEPRDDFYKQGGIVNWTDKVDYSKKVTIKSLNDKIANNIVFEYEEGDDFYSQQYINVYNETYGTKNIDLDNPYLKEDQNVKLDFQSYLMKNSTTFLFPKLYDGDNDEQTWFDDKIEYKPMIAFDNNEKKAIKMANYSKPGIRNTTSTSFSWAGHAKIMGGLSFDLNYETNNETFSLTNYDSDRGSYKVFWENYINNLIDDDSRIVEYYIKLDLQDILNLDFRDRVLIDGQMYFPEKVEYDPSKIGPSKVTLLKEIDPIEEGSFETFFLLKNDSGDYITTSDSGNKIIIN